MRSGGAGTALGLVGTPLSDAASFLPRDSPLRDDSLNLAARRPNEGVGGWLHGEIRSGYRVVQSAGKGHGRPCWSRTVQAECVYGLPRVQGILNG